MQDDRRDSGLELEEFQMMNKNDLLLHLCKKTAQVILGYDPKIYSIPILASDTGETKYRIRKLIKELETDGLVKRNHEGCIDDDGNPHCYHGWSITQKAAETEMYKKCDKEAIEEIARFLRDVEKCEREERENETA